jgi:hypothetical protein
MAKFLVLYNSPTPAAKMMANSSPEQMQAGMEMWNVWFKKVGNSIVDLGTPLDEGKRLDEQGKVSESESTATGYSFLEADSLESAVKLVENHPHLQTPGGASIEVLPLMPTPGM